MIWVWREAEFTHHQLSMVLPPFVCGSWSAVLSASILASTRRKAEVACHKELFKKKFVDE